jgi:hypothetical protein
MIWTIFKTVKHVASYESEGFHPDLMYQGTAAELLVRYFTVLAMFFQMEYVRITSPGTFDTVKLSILIA